MTELLKLFGRHKGKLSFSALLGLALVVCSMRGCRITADFDPVKARETNAETLVP